MNHQDTDSEFAQLTASELQATRGGYAPASLLAPGEVMIPATSEEDKPRTPTVAQLVAFYRSRHRWSIR